MINTKITIDGTEYTDIKTTKVSRTLNDNNSTSNFTIDFDNPSGRHASEFSLNDEVIIYADKDTDPATTKIFTGIIEDIKFNEVENKGKLTLSGRDYGAVLQDMTVQPIIFQDRDVGEIAKVIVQQNAQSLVTTTNIDTATGTVVTSIPFNHTTISKALNQLAELADFVWYVDENKDVHFEAKDSVSSGITLNNANDNTLIGNFKKSDKEIFNRVWVYGNRILTGTTEVGGIGAGSVISLENKPHNTRVTVGGVLSEPGGILGMNDPAIEDQKWLIDFNEAQVVFTSGTTAGENIPASGTSNVSIDYDRSVPLLSFKSDATSITNYGPKERIITDDNLKSFDEVEDKATEFLAENKDERIQGDLQLKGIIDLTPGNTIVIDFPNEDIDEQTYKIISVDYNFNTRNNLNESAVSITVNKKIKDFVDMMASSMDRIKTIETGPLEGKLTRLELAQNDVELQRHYEVWTGSIGSNFIFHNPTNGLFESPSSHLGVGDLAQGIAGSTLFQSGGDF